MHLKYGKGGLIKLDTLLSQQPCRSVLSKTPAAKLFYSFSYLSVISNRLTESINKY
jgi:hypothetical protein